jgi:TolB-like protein
MYRCERLTLIIFVLLTLLLTLSACRSPQPKTQTLTGYQTIRLNKIAIMPFMAGLEWTGADRQAVHPLDCPLDQFCETVNELGLRAEEVLTREMQAALERRLDFRVIPQARADRTFDGMPLDRRQDTPRAIARRFGRSLGADHVMLGKVWRFREYQENQGASVGFVVYLIEVDNGRRVWRGRFDRTQTNLLEDLRESRAFFAGGARWLSAREMSRLGIEQMLQTLPQVAE